ncbi:DUF2867 domain-containing protein [Conexibacter woesei]|uniref:DUF2867 domain-containing protein n=1 Tax=Conexibacter woesei TaxID=191495 RepID=UPI0003FA66D2|nr:DUF2867 domain-containing protein [Conexibacter woesei]
MSESGRLPDSAHSAYPWAIHAVAPDFALEDVWALPVTAGPDDFPQVVDQVCALDAERGGPPAVRALWAIRWKLGALLGWDGDDAGTGGRVATLRDRVPDDLRDTAAARSRAFAHLPFAPLYETHDEFAAEVANATMHGVMHLGWVPAGDGTYRAQMAVLVKPNGVKGKAYMLAIRPFRRLLVYPALMKRVAG